MMAKYVKEIVANLERSNQSIEVAGESTKDGYFDFAASRGYYAAFYAATDCLIGAPSVNAGQDTAAFFLRMGLQSMGSNLKPSRIFSANMPTLF